MMLLIIDAALVIASGALLALSAFLALEVFGAYLRKREAAPATAPRGPVAVIVPAHNEADIISQTLQSVLPQLRDGDRLIVVADNCTDATASVARAAGAEALERHDETRRGKGYALQFALDAIVDTPPHTVLFIDADCHLEDGALELLTARAEATARPVQAMYLMNAPETAPPSVLIAEFAWAFINDVRMRGLDRFFGVSRITGAGFTLPWAIAEKLSLGAGEIVEDLALTLDLTSMGKPPLIAPDALVTSTFPTDEEARVRQRARWEHGSRRLAVRRAVPAFFSGLKSGNWALMGLALDIAIPPIALLVAATGAMVILSSVVWFLGAGTSAPLALAAAVLAAGSIVAGFIKCADTRQSGRYLEGAKRFLMTKFSVYGADGRKSAQSWTPTRRSESESEGS
ncbi:MAG: glycosyltransferase family 2 protein [Pseudomonadota bacterium]